MEIDTELAVDGGGPHGMLTDMSDPSSAAAAASTSPLSSNTSVPISTSSSPADATLSSNSSSPSPPPPPPPPHELAHQFDLRRPIRTLLPASHQVTIPVRLLNAELTCIVCLGILQHTTAVSECLHRFCQQCINQSLRHHKKECPQCRVACPSHRNLRKDEQFDRIISSIYPDLEAAEDELERAAEALIDSSGLSRFAESAVKGAQKQAADAKQRQAETRKQAEDAKLEEKARRQREENSVYLRLEQLPSSSFDVSLGNTSVRTRKHISVDLLRLWCENKLKELWLAKHNSSLDGSAPSAPRVRVSIWCRWSEMSDVSRLLWNKARVQPPPPPPPPPPAAVAHLANGADSHSLVIRLPKFPPTSDPATQQLNGNHSDASSTTQPAPTTPPATASTDERMQDKDTSLSTSSRKRKRPVHRTADDIAGFVPHELTHSQYCQLGNRTPLRSLPSAVLDDSRVMGGRSGGGSGARRITLLYQADEVDGEGRLVKKLAVGAQQQQNGITSHHSAVVSSTAGNSLAPMAASSAATGSNELIVPTSTSSVASPSPGLNVAETSHFVPSLMQQ